MIIKLPKILIISLLTFIHSNVSAQFVLSGRVTNIQHEILPMASVEIKPLNSVIVANVNGEFVFVDLKPGSYEVIAHYVGYDDQSKLINLSSDLNLDIELEASSDLLDEVVVTHELANEKATQGYAFESLDLESLQIQSIELNQVLARVAGVNVRQSGGLGSRVRYSLNGLSDQSIRFFIDGIPMEYFGSAYSLSTIPMSQIDHIEIYKGVVPVELGSDALGGAMNLVTNSSLENSLEASYSFGSFNTHRASVDGVYRNKENGLTGKISMFYNYSDNNYEIWGDDVYVTDPNTFEIYRGMKVERFHDAFKSKSIKTDIGFSRVQWADHMYLGLLYADLFKEVQHGTTMEVPYGEATYEQDFIMPYLTYRKVNLIPDLDVDAFISYSHKLRNRVDTTRNIYNWFGEIEGEQTVGGEQARTLNELNEDVWIGRVNSVYHLNEWSKLGLNYVGMHIKRIDRDPLVTQKTEGYYAPQYYQKQSLGLSWQGEFLNDRLNLSLYSKWFTYQAAIKTATTVAGEVIYATEKPSDESLGYGMTTSYQVLPSLLVNASVEQAYRLPTSLEMLGDGGSVLSSTSLKPESSINVNMGLNWQMLDRTNWELKTNVNLFLREAQDLIQMRADGFSAFRYINVERVRMTGVDANLGAKIYENIHLSQTISYLNPIVMSDTDELGNDNIEEGSRLANIPFLQSNSNIRYDWPHLFHNDALMSFYWNVYYVGSYNRYSEIIGKDNKDVIPTQLINSCGVSYSFWNKKTSLSLDFSNLFNEQAFDNYAIQKPGFGAYIKVIHKII